jgi:hypothetical protein
MARSATGIGTAGSSDGPWTDPPSSNLFADRRFVIFVGIHRKIVPLASTRDRLDQGDAGSRGRGDGGGITRELVRGLTRMQDDVAAMRSALHDIAKLAGRFGRRLRSGFDPGDARRGDRRIGRRVGSRHVLR